MAFLDKLSKTVSEASQKTIAKTKELVDTSKLNSLISEEERKINNLYLQIGKLYVSLHNEDCENDFAEMMSMLADSEAKIIDYQKQIQDIKGVQRCKNCGAEVASGAAFCSVCGATIPKIQVAQPEDFVKCESCGADVKRGMRFCTSCGKAMEAVIDVSSETEQVVEAVQERVCLSCGTKVENGLAFCTECGTKL